MKKTILMALAILASASLSAQTSGKKEKKVKKAEVVEVQTAYTLPEAEIKTDNDSLSYAAGILQSRGLMDYLVDRLNLDTLYLNDFRQGLIEAFLRGKDPQFSAQVAGYSIAQQVMEQILPQMKNQEGCADIADLPFVQGMISGTFGETAIMDAEKAEKIFENIQEKARHEYEEKNKQWLEDNAQRPGVVVLPSGLQYKVLTQGTGKVASQDDNVTVKYEGKMIDGTIFDSSYTRTPDTTTFRPTQVIKGWTEALCMMPEGSVWELYIPQSLGYGSRAAGKIKPMSTLIFKVEVVKVGD